MAKSDVRFQLAAAEFAGEATYTTRDGEIYLEEIEVTSINGVQVPRGVLINSGDLPEAEYDRVLGMIECAEEERLWDEAVA